MNYGHFGDTYDFVKRGILQLLASCGRWYVHPMFTDDPNAKHYAKDYCRLLGVRAVNCKSFIQSGSNRDDWLAEAAACQNHLFLDPDTGLCFNKNRPKVVDRPKFLMPEELANIAGAHARRDKLTLVYDQSFITNRKRATEKINEKLLWLEKRHIYGFFYRPPKVDHPNFLLVSKDPNILAYAKAVLLASSKLPKDRLISLGD